jgi:hypothetical protein
MLLYPHFGHESLSFLRVEVMPGHRDHIAIAGENPFRLAERIHEGAMVHVKHVDFNRVCRVDAWTVVEDKEHR